MKECAADDKNRLIIRVLFECNCSLVEKTKKLKIRRIVITCQAAVWLASAESDSQHGETEASDTVTKLSS